MWRQNVNVGCHSLEIVHLDFFLSTSLSCTVGAIIFYSVLVRFSYIYIFLLGIYMYVSTTHTHTHPLSLLLCSLRSHPRRWPVRASQQASWVMVHGSSVLFLPLFLLFCAEVFPCLCAVQVISQSATHHHLLV